jgi:hypothetical protein
MTPVLSEMFAKQAAERADELRRAQQLPVSDRIERLMGLIASGRELLAHSPHREAQRAAREKLDAENRARWQELFRRHQEQR